MHISCDLCTGQHIRMTAVGDNSVVVSVYENSTVLRIDVNTAEVLWKSNHVVRPQGTVCYNYKYVLISSAVEAGGDRRKISILMADTGEILVDLNYLLRR